MYPNNGIVARVVVLKRPRHGVLVDGVCGEAGSAACDKPSICRAHLQPISTSTQSPWPTLKIVRRPTPRRRLFKPRRPTRPLPLPPTTSKPPSTSTPRCRPTAATPWTTAVTLRAPQTWMAQATNLPLCPRSRRECQPRRMSHCGTS
jgi:hypothetical protein